MKELIAADGAGTLIVTWGPPRALEVTALSVIAGAWFVVVQPLLQARVVPGGDPHRHSP